MDELRSAVPWVGLLLALVWQNLPDDPCERIRPCNHWRRIEGEQVCVARDPEQLRDKKACAERRRNWGAINPWAS